MIRLSPFSLFVLLIAVVLVAFPHAILNAGLFVWAFLVLHRVGFTIAAVLLAALFWIGYDVLKSMDDLDALHYTWDE